MKNKPALVEGKKYVITGINYFDAMVLPTEMKFIGLDETGDPNFTYVSGEKIYGTGKIMFFKHCEFYELGEKSYQHKSA